MTSQERKIERLQRERKALLEAQRELLRLHRCGERTLPPHVIVMMEYAEMLCTRAQHEMEIVHG